MNELLDLRGQVDGLRRLIRVSQTLRSVRTADLAVGTTPKETIYRDGKVCLFRYRPVRPVPVTPPVLVVYALFNRYYIIDLQEDRSLVRHLLDRGLDLYVVDWGYPERNDRWLTIDDYVNGYLDDCVEVICERHGVDQVNLLGICQGGAFAVSYAALHPERVRNLITMITPVDFHAGDTLVSRWMRAADADAAADALGLVPGELISLGFLLRSPFQRNLRKYVDLVDILGDQERVVDFLRMEKWIFDTPDVPGETYRQWIRDLYRENRLVKGGLELGGRRVDLARLTMPVLNVYGEHDDLVPPESSLALGNHVGTDDYSVCSFPVGHIGMYVSGKVQRDLPPTLAAWLAQRASPR